MTDATLPPPNFTSINKRDLLTLLNVISPLLFVTFVGFYFHVFVIHAIEANLAINLGIIFAALFGVVLMISRLLATQSDFRIIQRFGYEASQGADMIALLEQPWLKSRYVRHYLTHIANTGGTLSTQLEHSSLEGELHALQADYESRLELPQFLIGFMIAMGLLGTFIGLLETLTGIASMLDGMGGGEDVQKQFMKLVVELRKPLAGMGIAFSASMFGLISSLMLAVMMTNLRRYVSRVLSLARNVMHDLTRVARKHEEENSLATLERYSTPLSQGGVGDASFFGGFDVVAKRIELLVSSFNTHNENSRKLHDMLGVGPRMKETNEKALEALKAISNTNIEQQRSMQTLIDINLDVVRSVRSLAEQFSDMREVEVGSARHLHDIKETITKMLEAQSDNSAVVGGITLFNNKIDQLVTSFNNHNDSSRKLYEMLGVGPRMKEINEKSLEVLKTIAISNDDQQRSMRSLFDSNLDVVRSINTLSEQLTDSREVEISGARHLSDIKDNLTKLNDSLSIVDMIATGVSGQSVLLGNLVDETRRSQQELMGINRNILVNKS